MSSRHEDEQREKEARSRRPLKDGEWACTDSKCARVNAEHRNTCEMCGKPKPRSKNRVGKEIGKEMADKSKGLFAAEDWVCSKCGNVNWARRKTCNVCNAPKLADLERRTGYGGGYNDRQDVEYVKRDYDDEFDEFGRKKKRKSEGTNYRKEDEIKNEQEEVEEQVIEEASDEAGGDLDKYKLGSEEEDEEDDEDLDKYDLTADPEIAERKIEIIRNPPLIQNIESDCSCSCSGGECSCEDSECEQKERKERERISKTGKQRDREQSERERSRKRSRSRDKERRRSRSKERRRSRSKERERIKSRIIHLEALEFQDGFSINSTNDEGFSGSIGDTRNLVTENDDVSSVNKNKNIFSFSFYQKYFDVDTDQVLKRLLNSVVPTHNNYILDFVQPVPDLWGPFWISVTLVFFIGIFGNIAQYIENEGGSGEYASDFRLGMMLLPLKLIVYELLQLLLNTIYYFSNYSINAHISLCGCDTYFYICPHMEYFFDPIHPRSTVPTIKSTTVSSMHSIDLNSTLIDVKKNSENQVLSDHYTALGKYTNNLYETNKDLNTENSTHLATRKVNFSSGDSFIPVSLRTNNVNMSELGENVVKPINSIKAVVERDVYDTTMIGMVNVPCDSPIDFYASPKRTDSTYRQRPDNESAVPRTPTQKRTPSYRPLFTGNRIKIQYSEDGRKISDGVYLEQSEPNKLWEELLLRSFAHRIEDEIQSPVDSFKNLNEELAKLSVRDVDDHNPQTLLHAPSYLS
uniref:Zinc finger Ran-binding domain-containing protein 2 n=1 Tax=Heterorhabditis bacteriophora TaxID=37862 RepID=A0A1I7XU15_HETBA